MNIAAFDLSLTATGYAVSGTGSARVDYSYSTLSPPKGRNGLSRLSWIHGETMQLSSKADLVIFEGLAFGANNPSAQERAGLAYLIRMDLWEMEIPFALVAPTQLKKFVTGKGNAEKSLMLREVYRLWGAEASNDNEADAVGLLWLGRALVGEWEPRNEAQRDVVAKVAESNREALKELEAGGKKL